MKTNVMLLDEDEDIIQELPQEVFSNALSEVVTVSNGIQTIGEPDGKASRFSAPITDINLGKEPSSRPTHTCAGSEHADSLCERTRNQRLAIDGHP